LAGAFTSARLARTPNHAAANRLSHTDFTTTQHR
jgi:hypothetical protein